MKPFPSQSRIVNAILDGIKNAHIANLKWTNNSAWLSLAPEYMINIFIGQSIEKLSPMPEMWFEVSVKDLAESVTNESEESKIIIEAVERNNHQNEKIDIVLDDDEHSRVIIEVKNAVSKWGTGIEKDIERISQALKHESTLDYGVFAFFTNDDKRSIDTVINDLENQAKVIAISFNIELTSVYETIEEKENDWSCAAACFILKKQKSKNN